LGYSPRELAETPVFEQIHPDDRFKVLEASREACATGVGKDLQYRLRHKNGSWRILESTASHIKNERGEVERLVIVNCDVTERVSAEEKLAHNALHDALTDLPNRRTVPRPSTTVPRADRSRPRLPLRRPAGRHRWLQGLESFFRVSCQRSIADRGRA
jgi:PAS domain S-box-containing protein